MKRRGLTLMELLVASAMSGLIVVAVASAHVAGINFERQSAQVRERIETRARFEDRMTALLRGALITSSPNDALTYMVAETTGNTPNEVGADTLTFTTTAESVHGAALASEDEFEALNERFGPQGGIAEVSLSVTPLSAPGDKRGLFLREQRPSDGDPTQGGFESVLDPDIGRIEFEFYNGSDWDPSWGAGGQGITGGDVPNYGRRLPAAIRITYTLLSENEDTNHVFVVRLPNSDVTSDNPATVAGVTP